MSSTILYKFRSGTNFEPLPLPGTSARLFDIKRAIVRAKKLDSSSSNTSLEFDLQIQNANTNEVYEDESMILPRGTRVIVRRVAAERGRGILSRISQGGGALVAAPTGNAAARDGFYTIRSRDHEADDEFLDAAPPPPQAVPMGTVDESKELEAIMAVTNAASSLGGGSNSMIPGQQRGMNPRDPRGQQPPHFAKPPPMMGGPANNRHRPNADPELRQQELMSMPQPTKRTTGIPRTFLNLSAPAPAPAEGEGGEDGAGGADLASQLAPSAQAFQALVNRSGGQSLASASKRRGDFDYALRLTATTIPEHLLCGICNGIVKNAMLVPWDTEGRPTCESCIRDGLTKNGFTCPLTGTEGVSPDDLFPNVGLRKATEAFVKEVMEKMESIEQQIEAEEEEEAKKRAEAEKNKVDDDFDDAGDGIVTKKSKLNNGKSKKTDDDDLLLGGDDDFGGDVFDVAGDDEPEDEEEEEAPLEDAIIEPKKSDNSNTKSESEDASSKKGEGSTTLNGDSAEQTNNETNVDSKSADDPSSNDQQEKNEGTSGTSSPKKTETQSPQKPVRKMEAPKRRGPPAGYVLGPAGAGGGMPGGANAHNGMTSPHSMGRPTMNMAHQQPPPPPPPGPGPGRGGPPPGQQFDSGMGRGPPQQQGYQDPYGGRGGGRGFDGGRGGRGFGGPQHQGNQGQYGGRGGFGSRGPGQGYQQQGFQGGRGGGGGGGFQNRNQQWVSNLHACAFTNLTTFCTSWFCKICIECTYYTNSLVSMVYIRVVLNPHFIS